LEEKEIKITIVDVIFNRKGRKETLRPLGILWELCGKKIKER